MMSFLSEQCKDLLKSLNTEKGGMSSRKLAALSCLLAAIFIAVKYTTAQTAPTIVFYFLVASFLLLGVVTVDKLIQLRTGNVTTIETPKATDVTITTSPKE